MARPGPPNTFRICGQYDSYSGQDLPDVPYTMTWGHQGKNFVRLVRRLVGLRTLDLFLDVHDKGKTLSRAFGPVASVEDDPRELEDEPVLRVIRKLRGSSMNYQLRIRVIIKNYYVWDGRDTIFPKHLSIWEDNVRVPANYEVVVRSEPKHGSILQFLPELSMYLHNKAAKGANVSLFWESEGPKYNPWGFFGGSVEFLQHIRARPDGEDLTVADTQNQYLEKLGDRPNPTHDLIGVVQGCRTNADVEDITEHDELSGDSREHDEVNALQGLAVPDPIWAPEHPKKWEDLPFWRPGDKFPDKVKAQIVAADEAHQNAMAIFGGVGPAPAWAQRIWSISTTPGMS